MDAQAQNTVEDLLLLEIEDASKLKSWLEEFLASERLEFDGNALFMEKHPGTSRVQFGYLWNFPMVEVSFDELLRLGQELQDEWNTTPKYRRDDIARRRRLKRGALR